MSARDNARLMMQACAGREKKDQSVKELFSRKDFLANILKGTVSEYAGMGIREIMDCIEGDTIKVGTVTLSENAAEVIRGEKNQMPGVDEAPSIYDIIFRSLLPHTEGKELINLHINIEFQDDYLPDYPVEKRAVYYGSRRISSQLPRIGKNGKGYGKLEKVYTIWICMDNIPKYLQSSISHYKLINYKNQGIVDGKRKDTFLERTRQTIDLLEVVIIRLGIDRKNPKGVLDFLEGVFDGNQGKVLSYLPEDTEEEEREEVKKMMSLIDYGERRGEIRGELRGELRGEQRGRKLGAARAEDRMQTLIRKLLDDNRQDDLLKITADKNHLRKMYREYGIKESE